MHSNRISVSESLISSLVDDPENPRSHDDRNIEAIMASLRKHGQVEPLIVQSGTNMVIAGNGRAEAMRRLGWTHATVTVIEASDQEARQLSIALNRTGELAGWDEEVLTRHLQDLDGASGDGWLDALGFNQEEFEDLVSEYSADGPLPGIYDDPPPAPKPSPENLPSSNAKKVQLFLDGDALASFKENISYLGGVWNVDNQTDVVLKAVQFARDNS